MATKKLETNGKALIGYTGRDAIRKGYRNTMSGTYAGMGADTAVTAGEMIYYAYEGANFIKLKAGSDYSKFRLVRDNLANASKHKIADGSAIGGAAERFRDTEEVMAKYFDNAVLEKEFKNGKYKLRVKNSPEMKIAKAVQGVDFNNERDIERIERVLSQYGSKLNLTDSDDYERFIINKIQTDEGFADLAVAMNLNGTASLKKYVKNAEFILQKNIQERITFLSDEADKFNDSLDETVRELKPHSEKGVKNLLEKISKGEINASEEQVRGLKELSNYFSGKDNKYNYIYGRIASGQIDVEKIIADDSFGIKMNDDMKIVMRSLSDLANTRELQSEHHNEVLEKLGAKKSRIASLNLNDLRQVQTRTIELGRALEKAGYVHKDVLGRIIRYDQMNLGSLKKIDATKFSTPEAKSAFTNIVSLKQHEKLLKKKKSIKNLAKRGGYLLLRKAMSNENYDSGLNSVMTSYRAMKMTWKVSLKVMRGPVKKIGKRIMKNVGNHINSKQNPTKFEQGIKTINARIKEFEDRKQQILDKIQKIKDTPKEKIKDLYNQWRSSSGAKAQTRAAKRAGRKLYTQAGKNTVRGYAKVATGTVGAENAAVGAAGVEGAVGAAEAEGMAVGGAAGTEGAVVGGTGTVAAGTADGAVAAATTTAGEGVAAAESNPVGWIVTIVLAVIMIISFIIALVAYNIPRDIAGTEKIDFTLRAKYPDAVWGNDTPLDYITKSLKQIEQESDDVDLQLKKYLGQDKAFYSLLDPNDGFKSKKVADSNTTINEDEGYYYYFSKNDDETDYKAANPYSTIKKAISLAHVVTQDGDPSVFIRYAICSWMHLNEITFESKCEVCEGDGTYTYYCNTDDPIYSVSEGSIQHKHPGDTISNPVQKNQGDKISNGNLCIVEDGYTSIYDYRDQGGCKVKWYTPEGYEYTTSVTSFEGDKEFEFDFIGDRLSQLSNSGETIQTGLGGSFTKAGTSISLFSLFPETLSLKNDSSTSNPLRRTSQTLSGKTFTYVSDPQINNLCKDEFSNISKQPAATLKAMLNSGQLFYHSIDDSYDGSGRTFYEDGVITGTYCSNTGIRYCDGCESEIHYHTAGNTKCSCEGCIEEHTYVCLGHDDPIYHSEMNGIFNGVQRYHVSTEECSNCNKFKYYDADYTYALSGGIILYLAKIKEDGSTNCNNHSPQMFSYTWYHPADMEITDQDGEQHSVSYTKCDNCIPFVFGNNSKKVYECCGHSASGYMCYGHDKYECLGHDYHNGGSVMTTPCSHCKIVSSRYTCPGYTVKTCPGHTVCLGHIRGNEHHFCEGHTFTYCTGHMKYIVAHRVVEEDDLEKDELESFEIDGTRLKLFSDWNYEKDEIPECLAWDNTSRESADQMQTRLGFSGWDDINIRLYNATLNSDWYQDYGFSSEQFIGGTVSDREYYETNALFHPSDEYKKDRGSLALSCVGLIPTHPDIATSEDFLTDSTFLKYDMYDWFGSYLSEPVVKNGIEYRIRGLDPAYFVAWIEKNIRKIRGEDLSVVQYYPDNFKYKKIGSNPEEINHIPYGSYIVKINEDGEIEQTGVLLGETYDSSSKTYSVLLIAMGKEWSQKIILSPENFSKEWQLIIE